MLLSVAREVLEYLEDDCGLLGFDDTPRGPWQWSVVALMHGLSGQAFRTAWGN